METFHAPLRVGITCLNKVCSCLTDCEYRKIEEEICICPEDDAIGRYVTHGASVFASLKQMQLSFFLSSAHVF